MDKRRRLGKQAHKHDDRTLMLSRFFLPDFHVPSRYNFDKGKRPIPSRVWGNDRWGDCVIAGEANHLLRLERIEQRRTIVMADQDAIDRYKALTGAQRAGDDRDEGLVVLDTMRDWRNNGWTLHGHTFKIDAYGEIQPNDREQLRMANYIFHGVHLGFALPAACQQMVHTWDYNGEKGAEWQPGSWGGHLVYSKAFSPSTSEIWRSILDPNDPRPWVKFHGWVSIGWLLQFPLVYLVDTSLKRSIEYLVGISIAAGALGQISSWQAARAEVRIWELQKTQEERK
jgi:hypothetical protein